MVDETKSADEAGKAIEVASLDPVFSQTPVAAGFVTLTGRGRPNSEVEVFVQEANVGRAAIDANGVWQFVTRLAQPGTYEIAVADAGGMASEPTTMQVVEQVILATAVPVTATVPAGAGEKAALATVAPTPERSASGQESASAITIAPLASALAAGFVDIAGTGDPGSTVEVLVNDSVIGRSLVNAAGDLVADRPSGRNRRGGNRRSNCRPTCFGRLCDDRIDRSGDSTGCLPRLRADGHRDADNGRRGGDSNDRHDAGSYGHCHQIRPTRPIQPGRRRLRHLCQSPLQPT